MDDNKKMIQAILNGQNVLKQELVGRIDKLEKKLDGRIDGLEGRIDGLKGRIDKVEKNLTKRIDRIGRQLAYLDDDTPTREEFDNLENRVEQIEQQPTSAL